MILVHIETDLDGTASEVSLEAITFARNLSAEGGGVPVDAVVFNELSDDLHKELAALRRAQRAPDRRRRRRGVLRGAGGPRRS